MAEQAIQQDAGKSAGQGTVSQPAAAPAPAAAPSWYAGLPEGLRNEPSLQAFKDKDVTAVAESYVNAQKLIGSSVRLPNANTPEAERTAFLNDVYNKLGRPQEVAGYKYQRPAAQEMGLTWNAAEEANFLQTAHKLGLNSEQVQALMNWQADSAVRTAPDYKAEYDSCMKNLNEGDEQNPGWGSTTDRYLSTAKRVVDTMFPQGTIDKLDASGLSNDPAFIRGLFRIGRELMEDGVISGDVAPRSDGSDSYQLELDKMMDPKGAYLDPQHPDHEKAVQRALELRRFLTT